MPKIRRKKEVKSKKLEIRNLSTRKDREDKLTNRQPAALTNKVEFDNEKDEQKNRLIMWVGISCIMVVFFIAWIFNLKYEFKVSVKKGVDNEFNWSQAKAELDKAMNQVKQSIAQIKQAQNNARSVLPGKPELTPEQINLLKGKLLNEVATGTASSTRR